MIKKALYYLIFVLWKTLICSIRSFYYSRFIDEGSGNGSIIASHSKVINKEHANRVIIAGAPARVVKENISWTRDI